MRRKGAVIGDIRVVRRFLWIPSTNPKDERDWRWLEFVNCRQKYDDFSWSWKDIEWDWDRKNKKPPLPQKPYIRMSVISGDREASALFTKEMVDYANVDLLRFYYAQICNDLELSDDSSFRFRPRIPVEEASVE
jgi:hypothetical protein